MLCSPLLALLCALFGRPSVASAGAIYHTGDLSLTDTRFVANQAGVQGMAVESLGDLRNAANCNFESNSRNCPLGQYGYDEDLELVVRLR